MRELEMLYEGKAKKVFKTEDAEQYIVDYKDDATAFNGLKKGSIEGKGVINCAMSAKLFKMLEESGIPTHFIELLGPRKMLVKKVVILPLEVIVRNRAAGSFSKRFGVEEGVVFKAPTLEYCLKDDSLGDPMINDSQILAIGCATAEDLAVLASLTMRINELLKAYFEKLGIILVDFKLEFGRTSDGEIVLADEISPDTCRFWDMETGKKLDKDRFRRDLGGVEEAYNEMSDRLGLNL